MIGLSRCSRRAVWECRRPPSVVFALAVKVGGEAGAERSEGSLDVRCDLADRVNGDPPTTLRPSRRSAISSA